MRSVGPSLSVTALLVPMAASAAFPMRALVRQRVGMSRSPAAVFLIALIFSCAAAAPVHAATKYRHLTLRAAVQLCQRSRLDRSYRIAVTGFFRSGPENHGPDPINGAIFDSDRVPPDAARHIRKYHGVAFGARLGWKYSGSIDGITRPHARVSIHGILMCSPPFLKPEVISVSKV